MSYCKFLEDLFEDGRVTVDPISPLSEAELANGDQVISEYERRVRLDAPANAPTFDAQASRWAAERFHRACQLSVYRDYDQTTIELELDVPYNQAITPSVHYSVDLVFRFLPDLARFAGSAVRHDPLLDYLQMWAQAWPLSSVGMQGVEEVELAVLTGHPSLLQTYADRVIAEKDRSRLSHATVRDSISRAIGPFTNLAPQMAEAVRAIHASEDGPGSDNASKVETSNDNSSNNDSSNDKAGT